jgi:hypothetical protein
MICKGYLDRFEIVEFISFSEYLLIEVSAQVQKITVSNAVVGGKFVCRSSDIVTDWKGGCC